jgi:signal transduction histidine kinase
LLTCVDDEDRERVRKEFRRCIDEKDPWGIEFRHTAPDGRRSWIRADGRGFSGRRPRLRMVGVVQDVTERRMAEEHARELNDQLESTVRERTAALQASLDELNTFSYSVAHDLRAPLRSILGFSERLKAEYGAQMEPECRHYIDRVHDSGQRMAEVIDALLALARLTRIEMRRKKVNLSEMVRREMQALREEQPQRIVDCVVEDAIAVSADPALLRIVIENLLRNAWKFTSRHATARIEFGCDLTRPEPAYFICDDGAGFDGARAAQMFVPFRRLHPAREFEGIGVGLATVKRIIQRHGGTIWAKGEPEKGARISFTLGESVSGNPGQ